MADISKPIVLNYLDGNESLELSTTRAIIIFGKNSATYKFALLKTLMDKKPSDYLTYNEIGEPFLEHLVQHHANCPHQFNRSSTNLSNSMDQFLAEQISWGELISVAEKNIFNNVFDALQNIGGGSLSKEDLLFEHQREQKRIVLTDNLNRILDDSDLRREISEETEHRWRIVEEAWRGQIPPNLSYLEKDNNLRSKDNRKSLRITVPQLAPYQNGLCFYCLKSLDFF